MKVTNPIKTNSSSILALSIHFWPKAKKQRNPMFCFCLKISVPLKFMRKDNFTSWNCLVTTAFSHKNWREQFCSTNLKGKQKHNFCPNFQKLYNFLLKEFCGDAFTFLKRLEKSWFYTAIMASQKRSIGKENMNSEWWQK